MGNPMQSCGRLVFFAALALQALPAESPEIELEGVVTASSQSAIELFEGLLRIDISGATFESDDDRVRSFAELRPGVAVEVSALATSDGSLRAAAVEVQDEAEAGNELRGEISHVDQNASSFRIGPIEIEWTPSTNFKGIERLEVGELVEMSLLVSGGRLVAETIEREDP
jgi:hypothetical protein